MIANMPFSDYKLIKKIGKGAYGHVALTRHRSNKKKYVVKRQDIAGASERERTCAIQEAELMSKLRHPNIVSYRESFMENGCLFIAMGFCEGGDLYKELRSREGVLIDENEVVEWIIQMALGLQYLHQHNILHRDLKTQNVFLSKNKVAKLGDLGIAKVLSTTMDMATTIIGTPYYMSPELFSNMPYNFKSDVWSYGCCCYEMATLHQAFNAQDINALMYRVVRGKVADLPNTYSSELNNVVLKLLSVDADERPSMDFLLQTVFIQEHIERLVQRSSQKSVGKPQKSTCDVASMSEGTSWLNSDKALYCDGDLEQSEELQFGADRGTQTNYADAGRSEKADDTLGIRHKTTDDNGVASERIESGRKNAAARRKWRQNQNTQLDISRHDEVVEPLLEPKPLPISARIPVASDGTCEVIGDGDELDLGQLEIDSDSSEDEFKDHDEFQDCIHLMDSQLRSPRIRPGSIQSPLEGSLSTTATPARHSYNTDCLETPRTSMKIPRSGLKLTPLTGFTKTPLRGPLAQRAEVLREVCIRTLGNDLFVRAIEVLSRHNESEALAILIPELGPDRFEQVRGPLYQTVLCEQALQGLNDLSTSPESGLAPPVYMG